MFDQLFFLSDALTRQLSAPLEAVEHLLPHAVKVLHGAPRLNELEI